MHENKDGGAFGEHPTVSFQSPRRLSRDLGDPCRSSPDADKPGISAKTNELRVSSQARVRVKTLFDTPTRQMGTEVVPK